MAQPPERLERLRVPALHHVPPRRLRTEEDLQRNEEGGYSSLNKMLYQPTGLIGETGGHIHLTA